MNILRFTVLVLILVGCSTGPSIVPTETPIVEPVPSLTPPQNTIPQQASEAAPTLTPLPTAIGSGEGKIAFTSERDGHSEIYIMNPDGSDQIALINGITPKYNPAWSPDGTKIAFATNTDDSASLYIMNADGSDPVKLTDTKDIDTYIPANPDLRFVIGCCNAIWSPDGTKIVFQVDHYIGCCLTDGHIHLLGADGSYLAAIELPVWETAAWSPDSQKIALNSATSGEIYVMNADGTSPINLAPGGSPSWSPDGRKIAFHSGPYNNVEVHVMNADGDNPVNLSNYGAGWDGNPVWSHDGEKIAFRSYRDGNWEIYVMNADGTNPYNLTHHQAIDGIPAWSPDDTKIVFVSERDGNSEIYVINANGSSLVNLTNHAASDHSPVWSP